MTQQSFTDFFSKEIAPKLPELESARRERARSATTRALGAAFVAVVAALAAWQIWHPAAGIAVLAAGTVAGFLWARLPGRRHRAAVREVFIPPLLRYLGEVEYHRDPAGRFDLALARRSGILPPFTRAKLEDLFIGRHRETDFRVIEARLTRKRETGKHDDDKSERPRRVFSGLLCEVSVPVAFTGAVLLVGDKGRLGNRLAGIARRSFTGLEPVALGHAAFEDRYQVYSNVPDEARRLLQPGLLDALLALAEEAGGQAVNAAFVDGRFLLAIPQRRDLFETGRLTRSLEHAEDDLRRLAAEFTIPHRLIDSLHGDRKPVLPED